MYRDYIKRVLDFSIVLIVLLIIWPILLIVAVLLYFMNDGAGVFFLQPRSGKDGKIFKIVKFKTMNEKKDEDGKLLPDLLRVTTFGFFIRKSSLDELPQLINVLKGDMSLVGPRPLLVQYLSLYNKEQARRHDVRPGITGWAQVNGRNNILWTKKFELDVWYVDHLSFALDMKIIWMTICKVIKRSNINNEEVTQHVTTLDFNGNN